MSSVSKVINLQDNRYKIFAMAKDWMRIYLRDDEAKDMNQSEVVKRVMEDILSGKVSEGDIEKAMKEKVKDKVEKSEHKGQKS